MSTANTAERNAKLEAFATRFAAATLTIKSATEDLAVHTLAGFGSASSGSIAASAIADATIAESGTPTQATLTAGTYSYTLTVGTDITLSSTDYEAGGVSRVTSMTINAPA